MSVGNATLIPHKTFLALALAIALCGTVATDASASGIPTTNARSSVDATVARTTALHSGDAVIGALPMTQPMHVVVALKLRDKAGLDALVVGNAKSQAHGVAPQLLSSDQFLARHAPTLAQAQAVADYLTGRGFTNVSIAANRLLVSADGNAQTARDAFATTFAQVKTFDGRIAYANTVDARVPASLANTVLAVVGLQNVHMAAATGSPSQADGAHPDIVTTHDPLDFPTIYGGSGFAVAKDINIGIVSNGSAGTGGALSNAITDIDAFASAHSLPTPTIAIVQPNGANANTSDQVTDFSTQNILGMAGGQVKKIFFYNLSTGTDADLTADLNAIVAANAARIVEVPAYAGGCETAAQADGSAAADDTILEAAVAQGQTFVVGTGASGGADECLNGTNTPLWPASSQYVVAVAGTLLNATGTTWALEQVYNATGGSPSTFEPMPSWQTGFGVPGSTRGTADVAFDGYPGSGSTVSFDGGTATNSGPGLSASLFTGLWALVLEKQGSGFGFAGPVLYALPATDFHDITVGNNNGGVTGIGYSAATGYDYPSGRGSMIINNVLTDSTGLGNKRPVANFTFAVTGETVDFTDTSTDSDGTIVAHAWTFGDGGTSTATNPSHTYTSVGNFTVSDRVTDNDGATTTKSKTVTTVSTQLFQNPGFETGTAAPWLMHTSSILTNNSALAHSGNWFAQLGGTIGPANWFSQSVTIPSGYTSATVSFYVHTTTTEPIGQPCQDFLQVNLESPPGSEPNELTVICNTDATGGYIQRQFDVSRFIGQRVQLGFGARAETGPDVTTWDIDDVTLTVQ